MEPKHYLDMEVNDRGVAVGSGVGVWEVYVASVEI